MAWKLLHSAQNTCSSFNAKIFDKLTIKSIIFSPFQSDEDELYTFVLAIFLCNIHFPLDSYYKAIVVSYLFESGTY
jgi:hypothetical protein